MTVNRIKMKQRPMREMRMTVTGVKEEILMALSCIYKALLVQTGTEKTNS
jgi:hypothetical protein